MLAHLKCWKALFAAATHCVISVSKVRSEVKTLSKYFPGEETLWGGTSGAEDFPVVLNPLPSLLLLTPLLKVAVHSQLFNPVKGGTHLVKTDPGMLAALT
ncbi:TPA: hypothetical protein ACH3X1_012846 [Trebouxia sp. C0004]